MHGRVFLPAYLRAMVGYELRAVQFEGRALDPISALLQRAFPDARHFNTAVLDWQYRQNPLGTVRGFNAWCGDVLAGHYVTLPMRAIVDGQPERGLLSLNTATAPEHQGQGLFTRLANATYEQASEAGFGFVIGVSNALSTSGFIRRLGFQLVSPLKAMIGIGPIPRLDTDVRPGFMVERAPSTMAWRVKHPAYPYTSFTEKGRRFALSQRGQFGARYILGELDPSLPDLLPLERSKVMAKIWIGLDPAIHWRGSAYVNIPMRVRPSPLNLIFKDLTGKGRTLDANNVRFAPIDFDIL